MKILLSINYKFFNVRAKELIELVKKYDDKRLIKGFEILTYSKKEEKYVLKLAKKSISEGYIINLHSPIFKNVKQVKKYLRFSKKISKITKRKINIVYHPITAESIKESEEKTKKQLEKIIKNIYKKNYSKYIELSIENLNDMNGIRRIKKEQLVEILKNQPNLKFSYDIGHEIVDGIRTEKLQQILNERLNNIHIHTSKGDVDHYPIKDINEIDGMAYLLNQYGNNKTIVLEYALDYIDGENFKNKLETYIKYAENIVNIK